jgi:hypothetical protein
MKDWGVSEWTAFGTVLSGIGAILGVWAVFSTSENWRKQKLAERRSDQAERILNAVHHARDALGYIRSHLISNKDWNTAEAHVAEHYPSKSNDKKQELVEAHYYLNLLNSAADQQRAIYACLPLARALFGDEVADALKDLNKVFLEIKIAAEAITYGHKNKETLNSSEVLDPSTGNLRPNAMNKRIAEQVRVIEDKCIRLLKLEAK